MSGFVGFDPDRLRDAVGVLRRQADVVDLAGTIVRSCLIEAQLPDGVSRPLLDRSDEWRLRAALLEHRIDAAEFFGLGLDPVARRLDAATTSVRDWSGSDNDPMLERRIRERRVAAEAVVVALGLPPSATQRLLGLLDDGVPAAAAIAAIERVTRIGQVAARTGLPDATAASLLDSVTDDVDRLLRTGVDPHEAVGTAALLGLVDVDLDVALHQAAALGIDPAEAGMMVGAARLTGRSPSEMAALRELEIHFDLFDAAATGEVDGLVSDADLRHVVDHPDRFSAVEVAAAAHLLAEPELRRALDTAATHADLMAGDRFGSERWDDRRYSLDDLGALLQRSMMRTTLEPFRDALDVAGHGGAVDGFFSRADFEAVAADPSLPSEVRSAAEAALVGELFDATWLEANRDALAIGAGVLAGGIIIVASGGMLTAVVVGAGTSALSTTAINRSGDAESDWDGVAANAFQSGVLVVSVAGAPAAAQVLTTGTTAGGTAASASARVFAATSLVETGAGLVGTVGRPVVGDEVADVSDDVAVGLGIVNLANPQLRAQADDLVAAFADDVPTGGLTLDGIRLTDIDEVLQAGPRGWQGASAGWDEFGRDGDGHLRSGP